MLASVRKMLDEIETFLMWPDTASADLAAILTALRGNDNEDDTGPNPKNYGTIPVRRAAFPRLAASYDADRDNAIDVGDQRIMSMRYVGDFDLTRVKSAGKHFTVHTQMAHEAIERKD